MSLWNDITIGARLLAKDRGFTIAAVLALGLGIGANTTVFSIASRSSVRGLPFDSPDRIVAFNLRYASNPRSNFPLSYLELKDWQAAASPRFEGIVGFSEQTMNVGEDGRSAERFVGSYISATTFSLLRQRPVLGRDFRADDDRAGAAPTVILGHAMWHSRYASDPGVIGRSIRVNGVPSTVIGVMPEGLGYPINSALWQPLALLPESVTSRREERALLAFGRLAPGVTIEQAAEELSSINTGLARLYPEISGNLVPRVRTLREFYMGPQWTVLLRALTIAVAFLLLIGCANVANLQLARAARRARELSVRLSIGAGRWHIVRQMLVESLLLAGLGGVVGLAMSNAGVRMFSSALANTSPPFWLRFEIDGPVFVFLAAVSLGTAVLFGLVPALHSTRVTLVDVLNDAGRATSGGIRERRWTGALVTVQLALTLVLLTCAGLTARNLIAQVQVDAGIDTSSLVRIRLDLTPSRFPNRDQRAAFYRQLDERLEATFAAGATYASVSPLGGGASRPVTIEGRPEVFTTPPVVTSVAIGPKYFEALGARPIRGRSLTGSETGAVAIVNERFAAAHFPGEDPIGRRVRLEATPAVQASDWLTIVGVAPDVRQRDPDGREFDPVVYVPYANNPLPFATILVRSDSAVEVVAAQLREQVNALDPDLPVFDVMTLDASLAFNRWPSRVFSALFGIFATIGLVLASVGLYAVTAQAVSRRTREIGVRMALGARSRHVSWLVTRRASIQLAIGLVLGLAGSLAVGRVLQGVLTHVTGTDPVALISVATALVGVACAACLIPARRAMRLDPVAALRAE